MHCAEKVSKYFEIQCVMR